MSHTDSAHAQHGGPDNPEVAHEHTDVNVRALIGFAIGLIVVVGIVYVMMYGLFSFFDRQAAKNDPPVSPLARPTHTMPVTTIHDPFFGNAEGPRLVTSEPAVLQKHRQMEAGVLGTYGWVDEKAGVARLPIEEAKKLILTRGLPARADGPADPSLGTRRAAYGETSGGRAVGKQIAAPPAHAAPPAPAATPHQGHGQ